MQHDEFIGQVQHRARLDSRGEAERAVRATLQTLSERLTGGAADNLASQLPPTLSDYLEHPETQDPGRMSLEDFFARVSEREGVDLPKSIHHARCVIDVLQDAVTAGQMEKIRDQIPDEWDPLFESGSEGEMRLH